jgi:DNA-binding MarR family transcriptional regulator
VSRFSLGLEYLDVERLHVGYLDVKTFLFHTGADMETTTDIPTETDQQDHIDRFLAELQPIEGLDFVVEGIVDRIAGLAKRIHRNMERVLAEQGLSHGDWQVLGQLRNSGASACTPGHLSKKLDLSSGATTSRIDRLEREGLLRRLPDPSDRRGVRLELTDTGRERYERAVSVAARRERFFASALEPDEQQQLTGLLRKLMLAFETAESAREAGDSTADAS